MAVGLVFCLCYTSGAGVFFVDMLH